MKGTIHLKAIGYLISIISVVLLGMVAWHSATLDPFFRFCLLLGAGLSIVGMLCRWVAHKIDDLKDGQS